MDVRRNSYWLNEAIAPDEEACPSLHGDINADICIVGGGFTGLWTALSLKQQEPTLDIVILEKDVCGAGASGRNAGYVLSWWAKFASLEKICGGEEAVRLAAASAAAVDAIGDFCRHEGIDAHYRRDGRPPVTNRWEAGTAPSKRRSATSNILSRGGARGKSSRARAQHAIRRGFSSPARPAYNRRHWRAGFANPPWRAACVFSKTRR